MKKSKTSRIQGLFRLGMEERRKTVIAAGAAPDAAPGLPTISDELADQMVENALGLFGMPLGVATNFTINGNEVLVPMAVEEPSVIAAASNAAKMARAGGGFEAESSPPYTVAQVEILDPAPDARSAIEKTTAEVLELADSTQPELVSLGGGARELIVRDEGVGGNRLVVHLVVDCVDAMGANAVNTMAETIAGRLAELARGRTGLRILTNLADRRLARAQCRVPVDALARRGFSGEQVARGVVAASDFASADPYRAATHNKGIFNGIDAVLLATGNDWRAVEAGGHAYAARSGRYGPLAAWCITGEKLIGSLEMPMAVGIVGGAARIHPTARFSIELMGLESAAELAQVVVATGLATNLAALAALSSEGIQKGHMRLHARKLGSD